MDFGKAFTFVFEDKDWIRKLGFGGLFFFIGLLLLIIPGVLYLMGYQVAVGRNVYNGEKHPMPEPDDFAGLIKDGLIVFLAAIVYTLPILIIVLPLSITGGIMAENGGSETIAGILIFVGACFNIVMALGLAFFLPGVIAQYIRTGDLGACFRFGEIWSDIVQPNLVNILLILLAVFAAQLIAQLVVGLSIITICGPIILSFPAGIWASAFQGHLHGQLALQGSGKAALNTDFAADF